MQGPPLEHVVAPPLDAPSGNTAEPSAVGAEGYPLQPPEDAVGGTSRPHPYPRSLQRAQQPPASPRSRAKSPLLELVVVPRTLAIQVAEDALSMALVTLVLGTRPPVSPAMVMACLSEYFGIGSDVVSVRRTAPDDFIVRFTRQEDLELVLGTPWPVAALFALRWRRWSRLFMASAGAFRFRVLVGMKGIPAHARPEETAQIIVGSSSARVEIANPDAVTDPDDERELFVAAWCAHPDLVPDEKMIAIHEPELEQDGGSPLYLQPWEIIHDEVPALRYLVRIRLVEFQDRHTPPPSSDDDMFYGGHESSDSGGRALHASVVTVIRRLALGLALHVARVGPSGPYGWAALPALSTRRGCPCPVACSAAGFLVRVGRVSSGPWSLWSRRRAHPSPVSTGAARHRLSMGHVAGSRWRSKLTGLTCIGARPLLSGRAMRILCWLRRDCARRVRPCLSASPRRAPWRCGHAAWAPSLDVPGLLGWHWSSSRSC